MKALGDSRAIYGGSRDQYSEGFNLGKEAAICVSHS